MNRAVSLLMLSITIVGCARGRAAALGAWAEAAVAVRVAPVTLDRVTQPVTATGTLGPKEEVPLSFKVGGVIAQVRVDEGQAVRAGDTLALLDLSEIDAAVGAGEERGGQGRA